jgi:hypothetical protein
MTQSWIRTTIDWLPFRALSNKSQNYTGKQPKNKKRNGLSAVGMRPEDHNFDKIVREPTVVIFRFFSECGTCHIFRFLTNSAHDWFADDLVKAIFAKVWNVPHFSPIFIEFGRLIFDFGRVFFEFSRLIFRLWSTQIAEILSRPNWWKTQIKRMFVS